MLKHPRAHHPVPNDLSAPIGALSLSLSSFLLARVIVGRYTLNYRQLASATLLAFERSSGRRAENCKLLLHLPAFTSPVAHFQRPARGVVCLHSRARVWLRACTRALSSTSLCSFPLGSRLFSFSTLPLSLSLRPLRLAPTSKPVNHQSAPLAPLRLSPSPRRISARSKENFVWFIDQTLGDRCDVIGMTRLRLLCTPGLSPPPLFPSVFFFFSPDILHIHARAVCRSVRPSRLSILTFVRPLARPSARGTHARAAERARASVRVLRRRAHTRVRTFRACIRTCVRTNTRTRANVYVRIQVYIRRESASIASLSVLGHATHDIRRWGPCRHRISGDTRVHASLLIVGPFDR